MEINIVRIATYPDCKIITLHFNDLTEDVPYFIIFLGEKYWRQNFEGDIDYRYIHPHARVTNEKYDLPCYPLRTPVPLN